MPKEKSNIKSISIRIPCNLLKELHHIANYEGRSINSQVLHLIRLCVNNFKHEHSDFDPEYHTYSPKTTEKK